MKENAKPAVESLSQNGDGIWQDYGARIHRCPEALDSVQESFAQRIDPVAQAPKLADFWPIENIWSIIKADVAKENPANLQELKQ